MSRRNRRERGKVSTGVTGERMNASIKVKERARREAMTWTRITRLRGYLDAEARNHVACAGSPASRDEAAKKLREEDQEGRRRRDEEAQKTGADELTKRNYQRRSVEITDLRADGRYIAQSGKESGVRPGESPKEGASV